MMHQRKLFQRASPAHVYYQTGFILPIVHFAFLRLASGVVYQLCLSLVVCCHRKAHGLGVIWTTVDMATA